MHKWAWLMAISSSYCTPLHWSLKLCNRFNRQKHENDKIKFWKSVPSYVLVRKYQWRKKIIFIPSNKWENLKNALFYRQQIAYTLLLCSTGSRSRSDVRVSCNKSHRTSCNTSEIKSVQHKNVFFFFRMCDCLFSKLQNSRMLYTVYTPNLALNVMG